MFNTDATTDCLKIDLVKTKPLQKIEFKQHSKENRFYHIQILRNGIPVNITGYSISVFYKKGTGKTMLHQARSINPKYGMVQASITEDLISEYGVIEAELYLKKGDTTIVSPIFSIKVNRALYQTDDKPDLNMLLIEEQLNKMRRDMGSLSQLQTENKDSMVNAINSVKEEIINISETTLEAKNSISKSEIDRILSIFDIK